MYITFGTSELTFCILDAQTAEALVVQIRMLEELMSKYKVILAITYKVVMNQIRYLTSTELNLSVDLLYFVDCCFVCSSDN